MIKVRVGQTWGARGAINPIMSIKAVEGTRVHYSFGNHHASHGNCSVANLHDQADFIPNNDLEWLACNLDEWYCAASHLRNGSGAPFICEESHPDAINRDQWQNMRYYLYLDTKPHYEFFNGQWSETK